MMMVTTMATTTTMTTTTTTTTTTKETDGVNLHFVFDREELGKDSLKRYYILV